MPGVHSQQLRQLHPNDPLLDLYELDIGELHNLNDAERLLTDIGRIVQDHPQEPRLAERAARMAGNLVHWLGNLCKSTQ